MKDTKKLLVEAINNGIRELSKKQSGIFVIVESSNNIKCSIGEDEYTINVHKYSDEEKYNVSSCIKVVTKYHTSKKELEERLDETMREIGIPANLSGYRYIFTAILMIFDEPHLIDEVTKRLYPSIATHYDTTPSRVERAIRHAITVSWDRGNVDYLNKLFKYTVDSTKSKPTNSQFLSLISNTLFPQVFRNRRAV